MLNPRTKDAVDVLNGLVRLNNDRIRFYESFLSVREKLDPAIREFFALIVGESYQNNIWIGIEIQTIEGSIDTPTPVVDVSNLNGQPNELPSFAVLIMECKAFEENVREAYAQAMSSIFIPQYMRDLLKKQVRRLEAARRQLDRFAQG